MLLVNRVTSDGLTVEMALNRRNVIEVSPKKEGGSWIKYWDGAMVRSAVIMETAKGMVAQCRK